MSTGRTAVSEGEDQIVDSFQVLLGVEAVTQCLYEADGVGGQFANPAVENKLLRHGAGCDAACHVEQLVVQLRWFAIS